MADVRALLKAKREENRISHPFAAYSQTGQLRCTACSTIVKHASAWNGHLGSKSHRTNAARLKEEERLKESLESTKSLGKRKIINDESDLPDVQSKKLQLHKDRDEDEEQQRPVRAPPKNSTFPSDFFSDPSRAVVIEETKSDQDGEEDPSPAFSTPQAQPELDSEWARFQETVINAPLEGDIRETYDRATIFAEPQLSTEFGEGFPPSVVLDPNGRAENNVVTAEKDEGEERRRREEAENELILDRLLDEERAQEEADERVNVLKARLDLLKQRRQVARATRPKK